MMITALYASLCALLMVKLSLGVIALRRKHHVATGNGGHDDLQAAIRAQGNASEYIPISLILMLTLEMLGAFWWLIHLAGIALVTGRVMHASALKNADLKQRVLGMKITLFLIITLALLNIVYLIAGYVSAGL